MKLPFDFGLRFVLRLLMPGTVLAVALFPLVDLIPLAFGYTRIPSEVTLVAIGLIAGLTLLLLDMPIYMLLEGRRFWPEPLWKASVAREAKRLARLQARLAACADETRQVEFEIQIAAFPLNSASAAPEACYPTRLGNLLKSIETYPDIKYGAVGVFYWSRLWVSLDKDLREELDNAQAIVDGAVYTCFALAAAAPACIADAFASPRHAAAWVLTAIAFVVLSIVFYRAALPRYAQYGELFAAVFDQHRDLLKYDDLVADLDVHFGEFRLRPRTSRQILWAAWRFLRWHRYRRQGRAAQNETVTDWMK